MIYYRPQRSWAKAMFLQASVILSTGVDTPWEQKTPPEADLSRVDTPPGADTPLE